MKRQHELNKEKEQLKRAIQKHRMLEEIRRRPENRFLQQEGFSEAYPMKASSVHLVEAPE